MFAGRQVKFFALAGRGGVREPRAEYDLFIGFAVVESLKAQRVRAQR